MLTISGLKAVLAKYQIRPRKYLGQNFLVDRNIAEKIIRACGFSNKDSVLEIGAGLGALTEYLAKSVAQVIAVEKDKRVCAALGESLGEFENVKIVCADFLKMKGLSPKGTVPDSAVSVKKIKVIGNLPYYITTPIIEKLINDKDMFDSIFITVQKEVAQRLCAKPGSKDYGSISCFVQFHMRPTILFQIGKRAFYPQPEVDSVFLKLDILKEPPVQVSDRDVLFGIIRASFGKRRKILLNSLLSSKFVRLDKRGLTALLSSIGIDPNIRPEELSLEEFAKIADAILK